MFKTSLGGIEQQMIFDLQGLGLEPGEIMRNGGFGEPGTFFTLEYGGEKSALSTTCYKFGYDPSAVPAKKKRNQANDDSNLSSGEMKPHAFVARVGMLLQRLDRAAADLAQAELAYQQLVPQTPSPTQQLKDLGEVVAELNLDAEQLEKWLEFFRGQGDAEGQGATATTQPSESSKPTSNSSSGAEKDDDAKKGDDAKKDGDAKENDAQSPVADRQQAALERVQRARSDLRNVSDQLDEELAKGRNYIIFRWSEDEKGSAKLAATKLVSFEASSTRSNSGFAVAAGIRRTRLVIGRDLTDHYRKIDPKNRLVKWFEDRWSATGIVTEVLQVEEIRYFTKGKFEQILKVILAASPAELQGLLTPASLMSLKLSLTLTAQQLASYENRASLSKPVKTEPLVEWNRVVSPAGQSDLAPRYLEAQKQTGWITLVAVATSLKYLEGIGRLDRKTGSREESTTGE